MDSPAFAVTGMFTAAKVGNSAFTKNNVAPKTTPTTSSAVRMVVDPFQRKFQSVGRINIDYSRPKKLATYKRSGYSGGDLDYPTQVSFAGHYSVTNCGQASGASKILMKYDEYCAKGMMQVYKRSACPTGVYNIRCTEATVKQQAFEKRVFNRTMAYRQAQKPVNVRLREQYANRKMCFALAHNCSREESQFKNMPMSAATYLAGRTEALGTCTRLVPPSSVAEDYMSQCVRSQMIAKNNPRGVYGIGFCEEGFAKGDAEARRVATLTGEFRAHQQSASALTAAQYNSAQTARQLFASTCHHEETQIYQYPTVAAALCPK